MRLAVFDVDGTLIRGRSTEKRFIAWLIRHGFIGLRQLAASVWHVTTRFPVHGRHVFRKNKAYLAGLPESLVSAQAARFVETLGDDDWIRETRDEVRRHLERGDTVVLMSGTLQPIIDELARRLGAGAAIGTLCSSKAGRYSGKPPLRHPFYHAKADLLDELTAKHGILPADVVSYADSRFDIPMFERAGTPVAVGPDAALRSWAEARDCRIIEPA